MILNNMKKLLLLLAKKKRLSHFLGGVICLSSGSYITYSSIINTIEFAGTPEYDPTINGVKMGFGLIYLMLPGFVCLWSAYKNKF